MKCNNQPIVATLIGIGAMLAMLAIVIWALLTDHGVVPW